MEALYSSFYQPLSWLFSKAFKFQDHLHHYIPYESSLECKRWPSTPAFSSIWTRSMP